MTSFTSLAKKNFFFRFPCTCICKISNNDKSNNNENNINDDNFEDNYIPSTNIQVLYGNQSFQRQRSFSGSFREVGLEGYSVDFES